MKIFYQGEPGAYSHQVGLEIAKFFNFSEEDVVGLFSFKDVFETIVNDDGIGIIPIENSYAGSVHENFFHLSKYPVKIIGEYYLSINHCLCSVGKDIAKVKKAYSHYQALMQCENFLKKHNIQPVVWADTAGSAKYVKEQNDPTIAAISSTLAAKIYGLNILKENINDQPGNTTRFFIVVKEGSKLCCPLDFKKVSLLFKVKDMPAVLYKCLGAFATRNINLTKIESLPTQEKRFEYMFWIDFEKPDNEELLDGALKELFCFAKQIKILGKYANLDSKQLE